MRERFDALKSVLERERVVLGRLVLLAEAENEALVGNRHDAFMAAVLAQERQLSTMAELERGRASAAVALAEALSLPESSSLPALCEALPDDLTAAGREVNDDLRSLADRLSHVNRENDALVRQALHHTQHSIALLTGIAQQEARRDTYAPPGHGRRGGGAAVLDRRA